MNKLSNECIEAIENYCTENWTPFLKDRNPEKTQREIEVAIGGMQAGLTTESIYSKAGLISLEDVDDFVDWKRRYLKTELEKVSKANSTSEVVDIVDKVDKLKLNSNTPQLFQIYKQHKP